MTFSGLVDKFIEFGNPLIRICLGLGLVYFLYGMAQFIFASGDPEKVKEGRSAMLWGLIALFVMIAMWGLATIIRDSFGFDLSTPPSTLVK